MLFAVFGWEQVAGIGLGTHGLKSTAIFKRQSKASPVTAVAWTVQVGGPSLGAILDVLFVALSPGLVPGGWGQDSSPAPRGQGFKGRGCGGPWTNGPGSRVSPVFMSRGLRTEKGGLPPAPALGDGRS